jgi:hypothetical protein
MKVLNYIKARLTEASTWRGIILLVVAVSGSQLSPEETQQLITHALGIIGLFGILPDKIK